MISDDATRDIQDVFSRRSSASQWRLIWQRFRNQRLGMVGLVVLSFVLLAVIFIPVFFPNPYPNVNPDSSMWNAPVGAVSPMDGHIFVLGSDRLGRDFLDLLLKASQFTLLAAVTPTILVLIIGFILGAVAGYFGGWLDIALMQVTDFLLTLPLLPVAIIAIKTIADDPNSQTGLAWPRILLSLVIVFTLLGWMGVCRMVRVLVLSLRSENFVESAQALGASTPRILFRHLLPNVSTSLLVAGTMAVGDFAILETILAYFGIGIHDSADPSISSLGTLLAANSDMIWFVTNLNPLQDIRGYLILFPAIFLLIIVISINFIGDALRDVLDPRTKV